MQHLKVLLLSMFVCASTITTFSQVITTDEFQKGLENPNVQVLDVRTSTEFKNGHLKNSMQADWNEQNQFKERIQYIDKNKPVYIYCAGGGRSNAAAKWMRENGFTDIKELRGGINAWNTSNKPTEGQPAAAQLTPQEYAAMIQKSKTVLVDFGATWCPPCVKMNPVLKNLQKDLNNSFELVKLDPTVQIAIASQEKIESLPTFLIYKNGKEVFRKEGIVSYNELKTNLEKQD